MTYYYNVITLIVTQPVHSGACCLLYDSGVHVSLCSGDCLVLGEMIFNGTFNDLPVEQCVALLSCFVFEEAVCLVTLESNLRFLVLHFLVVAHRWR